MPSASSGNTCWPDDTFRIPVGISSCLLGQPVRYDGGHKYDPCINQQLTDFLDLQPYCPEVAIGLGTPRRPLRLVRMVAGLRVLGVDDPARDVTDRLKQYGLQVAGQFDDIYGYIFKSRSPSCGMGRVKTWTESGRPGKTDGIGAYAGVIMQACPNLPVEEEGRLRDPELRENFVERVVTWYRWQSLKRNGPTPASLVDFHSRQKLSVMAHNQAACRRLGQLVAEAGRRGFNKRISAYEKEMMSAMKRVASRRSHANVLQHLQGCFSRHLSAGDRAELSALIDDYRTGLVPLAAPLTLIRHHLRHHPDEWALQQTYLEPCPRKLPRQ